MSAAGPGLRASALGDRAARWDSLEPGTLVIADLHLDPGGEPRIEAFVRWLASVRAPRLVVLGDLFEVWVGAAQARMAGAAMVLGGLSAWTASGQALDVIPGNRDFLLGDVFRQLTGARLHPQGFAAALPGTGAHVLFVHGDELCTTDHAYQRMKRVLRSGVVRGLARRTPLAIARWAAGRLRAASRRAVARKPPPEKAMQADACASIAVAAEADVVVCGHAHEFRDERLAGGARWIVLDAWGGKRDLLAIQADGSLRASSSAGALGGGERA